MTFTVTDTTIYIGAILVLIGIQLYHQSVIKKLEKETKQIWEQIGIIVVSLGSQLGDMQKSLNQKKDKE